MPCLLLCMRFSNQDDAVPVATVTHNNNNNIKQRRYRRPRQKKKRWPGPAAEPMICTADRDTAAALLQQAHAHQKSQAHHRQLWKAGWLTVCRAILFPTATVVVHVRESRSTQQVEKHGHWLSRLPRLVELQYTSPFGGYGIAECWLHGGMQEHTPVLDPLNQAYSS